MGYTLMNFSSLELGHKYFELADSKKDDLNFLIALQSEVVPSGNNIKFSPFKSFFEILFE